MEKKRAPKIEFALKGAPTAFGSGSKGYYYKINSFLGVKIVGRNDLCSPAETARVHKEINKRCPGIFPKCYGCVNVTVNGLLRRAVLLEHIEGKTWEQISGNHTVDVEPHPKWNLEGRNTLKERLKDAGIVWKDDHEGNIMQAEDGTVRFIDPAGYVSFNEPVTKNLQQ